MTDAVLKAKTGMEPSGIVICQRVVCKGLKGKFQKQILAGMNIFHLVIITLELARFGSLSDFTSAVHFPTPSNLVGKALSIFNSF